MVFDIGDPIDQQNHDKFHNKRKEIKFKVPVRNLYEFLKFYFSRTWPGQLGVNRTPEGIQPVIPVK